LPGSKIKNPLNS